MKRRDPYGGDVKCPNCKHITNGIAPLYYVTYEHVCKNCGLEFFTRSVPLEPPREDED